MAEHLHQTTVICQINFGAPIGRMTVLIAFIKDQFVSLADRLWLRYARIDRAPLLT